MRFRYSLIAATFVGILVSSEYRNLAQQSPAAPEVKATDAKPADAEQTEAQQAGGFVPGQARPHIDPAVAARGKTLYAISCQGCHGPDLRGGDMGGPNLLRSQVTLSDRNGELIIPIIKGSREAMGMPAIPLNEEDSMAVAAYVRSVISTIGVQGTPPGEQKPLNIVVGNANAGEAYFTMKCKSCHSPEGDLRGIATRISSPKSLQNAWVMGGVRRRNSEEPAATAEVILASGEKVEGRLLHIDDFLVTVKSSDGSVRTFKRNGTLPKVTVHDPLKAHKDLLPIYTDKDIHDVTAYLVTLK